MAALIPVVLLLGCGKEGDETAEENSDDSGSCPAALVWHGQRYDNYPVDGKLEPGDKLDAASFTDCSPNDADVSAFKLPGVEPTDAFVAEMGGTMSLYVSSDLKDPCAVEVASC